MIRSVQAGWNGVNSPGFMDVRMIEANPMLYHWGDSLDHLVLVVEG